MSRYRARYFGSHDRDYARKLAEQRVVAVSNLRDHTEPFEFTDQLLAHAVGHGTKRHPLDQCLAVVGTYVSLRTVPGLRFLVTRVVSQPGNSFAEVQVIGGPSHGTTGRVDLSQLTITTRK